MPKVLAAHRKDQRTMYRLRNAIARCGYIRNRNMKGARRKFIVYLRYSSWHKRCRGNEAVKYSSMMTCRRQRRALYQVRRMRCGRFGSYSRTLGSSKNNRAVVGKAGGESPKTYITRL